MAIPSVEEISKRIEENSRQIAQMQNWATQSGYPTLVESDYTKAFFWGLLIAGICLFWITKGSDAMVTFLLPGFIGGYFWAFVFLGFARMSNVEIRNYKQQIALLDRENSILKEFLEAN